MQRVFVLDKNKNPLMPCHPARARQLLTREKAAVFRQYPFTIILKERDGGDVQPLARPDYPKAHWIDAACVGESGDQIYIRASHAPLQMNATGHQSRQMCRVDKYGFPRTSPKQGRVHFGFQTGDMVKAIVTKGVKCGTYTGRISVRTRGSFNITTPTGTVQGISYRYRTPIHNSDGYFYEKGEALSSATTRVAVSPRQNS